MFNPGDRFQATRCNTHDLWATPTREPFGNLLADGLQFIFPELIRLVDREHHGLAEYHQPIDLQPFRLGQIAIAEINHQMRTNGLFRRQSGLFAVV